MFCLDPLLIGGEFKFRRETTNPKTHGRFCCECGAMKLFLDIFRHIGSHCFGGAMLGVTLVAGGIWHPEKETSPKNTPLEARPMWPLGPRSNEPRRGIYQGLSHFGRIKVDANVWSFWGVSLGTVHEVWVGVIMIFFFRLEDVWLLRIAENAWVGSRSSESWGLGKKQGRMCCFPFGWILFFLDSKDERSGIVSTCIFFRWLTRNDVTGIWGSHPRVTLVAGWVPSWSSTGSSPPEKIPSINRNWKKTSSSNFQSHHFSQAFPVKFRGCTVPKKTHYIPPFFGGLGRLV